MKGKRNEDFRSTLTWKDGTTVIYSSTLSVTGYFAPFIRVDFRNFSSRPKWCVGKERYLLLLQGLSQTRRSDLGPDFYGTSSQGSVGQYLYTVLTL